MFTFEDVYTRIREQPFKPIRIVTSSGESYDVHHPDLVMIGERYLLLGTASSKDPRVFDRESRVSIVHITAIENLPTRAPTDGDGRQ